MLRREKIKEQCGEGVRERVEGVRNLGENEVLSI